MPLSCSSSDMAGTFTPYPRARARRREGKGGHGNVPEHQGQRGPAAARPWIGARGLASPWAEGAGMTVQLVRAGSLYEGVPYAYASVAPRGSLIFTAGACPLDDRGDVVGAGDVRVPASLAVDNLAT